MRKIETRTTQFTPLTHLKESEAQFKTMVREFAATQVAPLVFDMDQSGIFDATLITQLFQHGFMSIDIPTQFGGQGRTFFETILATEEMSRIDPSVAVFMDVQNTLVANAIVHWGTDEQKRHFLTKLATNTVGAFSISEKEAGSDAYALTCQATPVEGGYVLNGEKYWVTSAAEAEIFLIFAKVVLGTDRERLTAFILEKSQVQGLTVKPREDKMGIRASSTCRVLLENVRVTEANVLGGVGRGQRVALETITDSRIGIAAQMLGLAQGAFDAALQHAQHRKQFGQMIAAFQGVMFPLADMATEIQAARLLVYNAARLRMAQADFGELFSAANMAKHYASKVAEEAASQAVEIYGGLGYLKKNPAEKFYRDAKIGRIYEGTTNMQRRSIARSFIKGQLHEQ